MSLGHEKLDVYKMAIQYVAWVFDVAENLEGINRHARDQLLRASQSIPLNIAEGNGKTTVADRRKYFEIARGSALECAAIQDVLHAGNKLDESIHVTQKNMLDRIAIILSRLGGRGFGVHEQQVTYENADTDLDTDLDFDLDLDESLT